jgi:WS/DGAT/MGAT family acyltransferase
MNLMSPTDAMFLIPESRDQPMHVGSLQLLRKPEGAGKGYLTDIFEAFLKADDIAPDFRKRPHRSAATLGQWTWVDDADVDLEHHLRHSALPRPGRIRELLALVSRLHATLLDRHRPLWEMHLIEGLEGGDRFAVYTKMHHSLMDGVSGFRLLQRSLSTSPDDPGPGPWFSSEVNRRPDRRPPGDGPNSGLLTVPRAALRATADVVGVGPALVRVADRALRETRAAMPLQAPRSIFNVGITGSRRFAAQSWPMGRLKAVGKASDTTLNDVVLAVCSGALRTYLMELGELPERSLVAMNPVSLRKDDASGSGNAVAAVLCNLGTDIADAAERLSAVHTSMVHAKEALSGLNQLQATALSALVMAPVTATLLSAAASSMLPPAYNLVISNVPGPQQPLYFHGAQLEGVYPLSIPTNGQALNITLASYNGNLEFGLIGCRSRVPHLQRLLIHLEDSLSDLEKAAGVA